jgi:hypothetical protein
MKCAMCNRFTLERRSCNAMPIVQGRCCFTCDDLIVTPVRILMQMRPSDNEIVAMFRNAVRTHHQLKELRRKHETSKA